MNDKPTFTMGHRPPTAFESYERDISIKSIEVPALKMQGAATVKTEDVSEDVLRRSLLKFYSLHITDFPSEETLSLVGDDPDELITAVKEMWPEYSVEFCIGTIWRNDTGAVVGQLVEDPEDHLSQGWAISDGEDRFIPVAP